MKKSLLVLICIFALLGANAQNSGWIYDFGTTSAVPYTSTTYSSSYLPATANGGGNAAVRASSATEGPIELTASNLAGGSGAELKMTSGTATSGAKFGLAPFTGTTVATFQCKINISSGTNGRFILYFGNGSNFTSGSGISVPQTFASLRLSPTSTAVSLDWLSSSTSPNYTTTGLSQTTINKNQGYTLKFFMNNSNNAASYTTGSGAALTTHNLAAGTFDVWLDNTKILINADPGTGLLPQGTSINAMNLLNVGAGSSAPIMYIDDISYTNFLTPTPPAPPAIVTNTILNIDYETGTTNSGITGINATDAPASDAAYMIQPGATGNWAIAHKIVGGDANYFSDNNYRSEADAVTNLSARYQPGDERRYEFSVLLKDWVPFNGTDITETSIFQLKMSNDMPVPLMVRTKRNNIDCRYGNMDGTNTIIDIVNDVQPFINNWIHFRVDVKWAMDNTGYIKVYMKLPGSSDYSLANEQLSRRTFTGDPAVGNVGYIKWGVYVAPTGVTRIAYHDDIRIYELNNNSIPTPIWNNPINDNNPAYQPNPYSPATDVLAAGIISNDTTPSSDFSRSVLLPAGGTTLSGRYLLSGWANATAAGTSTALNPTEYYEFKLQTDAGYKIDFSSFAFTARRGNTTDPSTYVMRSSLDGFTNNITAPQTFSATAATSATYNLSPLSNVQGPITFRLYWYGATRTEGTGLVGIDNFTFNGLVRTLLNIPVKPDVIRNTNTGLCTYTAQTSEFDVTAVNNCSSVTYSYSLTGATTATGNVSLANKVFNKGITTVSWTATDACTTTSTSFTVKVNDTEKPIFTVPASITVNNDENQCSATVILTQPTATDNCAVANITNDAPSLFPIGVTTVTWTATDASGNTATATQTVTVKDTQTPAISAPANVNVSSNADSCFATNVALGNPTTSDNCTNITLSNNAPETFPIGTTTVTWTATDASGNTATATQTVTINDTQVPTITAPANVNINSDSGSCYATNVTLGNLTATDNCTNITVSNNAPEKFPIGVTAVTWTATDGSDNKTTATQTVTVADTEVPVVSSTASVALCHETGENYTIPVATATDNCIVNSITYQITGATVRNGNGLNASGSFNVGTSTITWTVTDNTGNSSTTTTTVKINSVISASIADVYTVSPGGNPNTIYLGYSPSSLTLTATAVNGTAPYSYSWSNGVTTASNVINPSTAGVHNYTATITDALGCSFTVSKQITVVNILCADGKVKICHSSSPSHDKSLCISSNGVSDHLAHGCYLGTCSTLSSRNSIEITKEETNEFTVTVAPNPSKTEFQISITGDPVQAVYVSIFDISGRRINNLKTNPGQTITTGSKLAVGMYLAEIIQGKNKKTVKLIKQ